MGLEYHCWMTMGIPCIMAGFSLGSALGAWLAGGFKKPELPTGKVRDDQR